MSGGLTRDVTVLDYIMDEKLLHHHAKYNQIIDLITENTVDDFSEAFPALGSPTA